MGKNKAKPVDTYRAQTEAAAAQATPVSENTKKVDDYTNKLWDIYTGKTTFDVNNLPNSNILMPLYNSAKQKADNRVGTGLNYGEGGNSDHIAAVREQLNDERARSAAGQLENNVFNTFNGLEAKMLGLGATDQESRNNAFARSMQMYGAELNKPQKPKWWQSLLGGAMGAATSYVSGGLAERKSSNVANQSA